jgi:hypothetical protein
VLRALHGGGDPSAPLRLPASASLAIMDDLVERGFRVDEQSLGAVTPDEARYLVARTHPELLTDEDIDALDFVTERDRRTMLTGRIPDPTADRPDSPMMAAIRSLVVEHKSDPLLREQVGPVADALAALLATPSAETLVDVVTDDDSTWGLLEEAARRRGAALEPTEGSSARRFLGWLALRRTQQSLYVADWHQALQHGRHALRLAETEAGKGEALNMQAFAEWQLHRDDAAKKALEAGARRPPPAFVAGEPGDRVARAGAGPVEGDVLSQDDGDRRNPYVILGIPFGADRATAERAYSQRSRLARKGEFPFSVEDIIWRSTRWRRTSTTRRRPRVRTASPPNPRRCAGRAVTDCSGRRCCRCRDGPRRRRARSSTRCSRRRARTRWISCSGGRRPTRVASTASAVTSARSGLRRSLATRAARGARRRSSRRPSASWSSPSPPL